MACPDGTCRCKCKRCHDSGTVFADGKVRKCPVCR